LIGKTISHYKILEKLGEGGMGVVYLAEDSRLKRKVVLKLLHPHMTADKQATERFEREAQAAAKLNHPNIITVHEISEHENRTFIAMEYIEGGSLRDYTSKGPIPIEKATDIVMQICHGLNEAHQSGIVHRDIKPENILINKAGLVKIADFGLARIKGITRLTKDSSTLGTLKYMSPEQLQNKEVDYRSDIWSFGVLLFEMLTGQLPFEGEYEASLMYAVINEEPKSISKLSPHCPVNLNQIVNKMLIKNPDDRFQNVEEIIATFKSKDKELYEDISISERGMIPTLKMVIKKRIPHILLIYIIFSFLCYLGMKYLVNQFMLSPYLPSFCLVALISLIPIVASLIWIRRKLGRIHWTKLLKIVIPTNFIVSVILLLFIFHGKSLGTVMTNVTLTDEEGVSSEYLIPRAAFRKNLAIFYFNNVSGDSTLNWYQYAIPIGLQTDLMQDMFIETRLGFVDELKRENHPEAIRIPLSLVKIISKNSNMQYFVFGSFHQNNGSFSIKASIYETKTANLIAEKDFSGKDIFSLIDEISLYSKRNIGIPQTYIDEVEDMPVAEILTNSLNALRNYVIAHKEDELHNDIDQENNYLKLAIQQDTTFALAYRGLLTNYIATEMSPHERNEILRLLMKYEYKLPKKYQFQVKQWYYRLIKYEPDKILSVAKTWIQLYPNDIDAYRNLIFIYGESNQRDQAILVLKKLMKIYPEQEWILSMMYSLYRARGNFHKALNCLKKTAKDNPEDPDIFTRFSSLYSSFGYYEESKRWAGKALILEPDNIEALGITAESDLMIGRFDEALKQFHWALEISDNDRDRSKAYWGLYEYYRFRGQLKKAVEYIELAYLERAKYNHRLNVMTDRPSEYYLLYIDIGKKDIAFGHLKDIELTVSPHINKLVYLEYLAIYIKLGDILKSEEALKGAKQFVLDIKYLPGVSHVVFEDDLYYAQGRIKELKNEYDQALVNYQKAIEIEPTEWKYNMYMSQCYRILGDLRKAKKYIEIFLKVEPFNPEANYELALVYHDMGKTQKSLEHLETAMFVLEDADENYKPALMIKEKLNELKALSLED